MIMVLGGYVFKYPFIYLVSIYFNDLSNDLLLLLLLMLFFIVTNYVTNYVTGLFFVAVRIIIHLLISTSLTTIHKFTWEHFLSFQSSLAIFISPVQASFPHATVNKISRRRIYVSKSQSTSNKVTRTAALVKQFFYT